MLEQYFYVIIILNSCMDFCWLSEEHRFNSSNFFFLLIECSGAITIDFTQEDSGDECTQSAVKAVMNPLRQVKVMKSQGNFLPYVLTD